ncbi:unnamed protein product [Lactuca virosa]|uniref:Zinc finger GRF-type domain-containing protein n=1 Tax=Lactuca virosa TaxID=75947 RepID=A0AAU9NQ20_9ASTR|nr:unnamed protein product [Lactuca virosa]
MAYSSGSSSDNHTVLATRNRDNDLCACRHPKLSVERMSMSDKNPACRFRNCVDSLVEMAAEKCKYFKWIDDELTPHYKNAFNNLKYELKLMKDASYATRLERRVALLENMNAEAIAAKEIVDGELAMAIEEKKQLRGELKFVRWKFRIAMMFLLLLAVVLMMQKAKVVG